MSKKNYYEDSFPGIMLEKMKNGCLPAEVAGVLGVRKEDVLSWLKDARKTDFRDSFKIGMAASEHYWVRMGMEALTGGLGKTFKERLYMNILETQFGWRKGTNDIERLEHETVMTDEELDARLEELMGDGTNNIIPLSTQTKGQPKKRKAA